MGPNLLPGHTRRSNWQRWMLCLLLGMASVILITSATERASAQPTASEPTPPPSTPSQAEPAPVAPPKDVAPAHEAATPIDAAASAPTVLTPEHYYDLWVLVPAIVAILLAMAFRQVIPALVVGVLVGAYMISAVPGDVELAFREAPSIIAGVRVATEHYLLNALADRDHLQILIFTLTIGFTVGVIGRNGGTAGLVRIVVGDTTSRRRGMLTAWLAGLVVFFDDYANTMIVGPTMRSVFDRLKLSRAKLAYIVDSTAAPVASIAIIGTWVGMEIGYIQDGINRAIQDGVPSFLAVADSVNADGGVSVMTGMEAFLGSLRYRFYPLLALFFVFVLALTGRDFGPMRRAEARALEQTDDASGTAEGASTGDEKPRWMLGLLPILVLIGVTLTVLYTTGRYSDATVTRMAQVTEDGTNTWDALPLWRQASFIISNANSYVAILYGALLSATFAVVQTMLARVVSVRNTVEAGLDGMGRMFPAVVILALAWALSAVSQDLQLGEVVTDHLDQLGFSIYWLPTAVFISAALISFATGTSWGTLGILCPITVEIAVRLIPDAEALTDPQARSLFYASVGSVLAGAIFGDHCSPISDTTVLSSIASGCRHEEHVWTQMPYAIVVALVAIGLGDALSSRYHQPWYIGLTVGAFVLLLFALLFGRRPRVKSNNHDEAQPPTSVPVGPPPRRALSPRPIVPHQPTPPPPEMPEYDAER
jgi:Na+/H+ antiporter NhaC